MEHFSRATEEELDRRGEAKHFLYELQQDFFFDDGETLFPKKKIYISCRVTTLAAAVAQMTGYNITSRISCKVPLSD